jgi:hypothetical protein
MEFIDYYSALAFLPRLTDFSSEKNSYITIVNETTHSNQELQPPNFEPNIKITNREQNPLYKVSGIDGNIAALKRLGEWIQYLKDNDCYDNTKIIVVSDHGIGTGQGYNYDFQSDWPFDYNPDHNHPILFVKDFDSDGKLAINNDFMTNADVPSLAFKDIIENPINPNTGKMIKSIPPSEKKASGIVLTHNWRPGSNNTNTYRVPDKDWYTVSENLFEAKNWQQGIK